jgi:hypothetical protein
LVASIVLVGALTFVFYRSLAPTEAATSNITVINNNQTLTTTQDTNITTITRTSEVNVKDTSATHGYTLTAQISANNLTGATITVGSDTSSECPKTTPCALSSTPTNILITTNNNATTTNGETTTFEVVITIPANSNIGAYTLDIAYDETANLAPTTLSGWVKSTTALTGASATNITVDKDANMLPVVYNTDLATANTEWANYDNKKWANALTLVNNKTSLNSYDQDGTRHTDGSGQYTPLEYYKDHAPIGTEVSEDDILGYWTYIPRYKYQVTRYNATNDNTNYRTQTPFNITFQKTTDPKATPTAYTGTGDYQTNVGADNAWATHPAFTVGSTELSGFWYGKFESSRSDNYYCHTTSCNGGSSTNDTGVPLNTTSLYATIKPNYAPATHQKVSIQYLSAEYIKTAHNLSNQNTHMSTNNHWGAATYLSTSTYGVGDETCTDTTCSTNFKKTYNNGYYNNSISSNQTCSTTPVTLDVSTTATGCRYITGAGPVATHSDSLSKTLYQYHTTIGQQASTTGNIYGIYDMAGGTYEYQMAVYTDSNGDPRTGNSTSQNSGFTVDGTSAGICYSSTSPYSTACTVTNPIQFPANQYLNTYNQSNPFTAPTSSYTNNNYCTYATCGGQALHETKAVQSLSGNVLSWGEDYSGFVYVLSPWFARGGSALVGSNAGLWDSNGGGGDANNYGWRAVAGAY